MNVGCPQAVKDEGLASPANVTLGIKKPKRVIHFSDGVMEEYSSDEEDGGKPAQAEVVDPVS